MTETLKKLADKLLPLFLMLAIVWLCWGIARGFWLFLSPMQSPNLPVLPRVVNSNAQANNPNTFNIFATPAPAQQSPIETAPPANLDLKGVMVAVPESNSSALIAINGQLKNYRVGEPLESSNYTLDTVDWNSIALIDPNGKTVTITLNDPFELNQTFDASKQKNTPMRNTRNVSSENAPPTRSMKPISSPIAKRNDNQQKSLAEKAINTAADQLEQDAAGYLSSVGVLATGDGYEITDSVSAGLRSRIGLKAGDKIVSVNGQDVGYIPTNDAKLLREIRTSKKAEIKVKRGEKIITIRQSF